MAGSPSDTSRLHTVRAYDDDLAQLTGVIIEMGGTAERQVSDALESLLTRDVDIAQQVIDADKQVDRLEEAVDQQVVRLLATRQPVAVDLRIIAMALKISNDLERMSDYAVSIAKRTKRLADQPEVRPLTSLPRMTAICMEMVKTVLDAYVERDAIKAMQVWNRDRDVDELYTSLVRELITYMLEDPKTISRAIDLLFIAKNVERIGDHATNVAEKINYMIHGTQINRTRHDQDQRNS